MTPEHVDGRDTGKVIDSIAHGEKKPEPVPERRPPRSAWGRENTIRTNQTVGVVIALPYPVWRCKVCGYLCARNEPPETYPICKVKKERFERFM